MVKQPDRAVIGRINGPVLTGRYPSQETHRLHDLLVAENGVHMEVAAFERPGAVRCIALHPTHRLSSGMTGEPPHRCNPAPVGPAALRRAGCLEMEPSLLPKASWVGLATCSRWGSSRRRSCNVNMSLEVSSRLEAIMASNIAEPPMRYSTTGSRRA